MRKNEEIKYNKKSIQYIKWLFTEENVKEHNPSWKKNPDHPYRKLIIGGSGSGKTNSLSNLIYCHSDINKIYPYPKDPYKTKFHFLISKDKKCRLKAFWW